MITLSFYRVQSNKNYVTICMTNLGTLNQLTPIKVTNGTILHILSILHLIAYCVLVPFREDDYIWILHSSESDQVVLLIFLTNICDRLAVCLLPHSIRELALLLQSIPYLTFQHKRYNIFIKP